MRRYAATFGITALLLSACGEQAVQHTDNRHARTSRPSSDADATASSAEISAELQDIIGYTCPAPPTSPAFGVQEITVRAKSYWTSTGLYLREGEKAHFTSTGTWTIWAGKTAPFSADGGKGLSTVDDCLKGALVAKIGLSLDAEKICVGADGSVTAPNDGIVYLAMNDSASPAFHDGEIQVAVDSAGEIAPPVTAKDAADYDFCSLASGWAEVESPNGLLLTLPSSLAASQQTEMPASLDLLDQIYETAAELFGGEVPYGGEALRFYPDFAVRSRGWIVAGNPLLFDPKNLNAATPSAMKILDLDAPGAKLFDFTRAIGVDVSRSHGGRYQSDENASEAWGGLVAAYVAESVAIGPWPRDACLDAEKHAATGSFEDFQADPWLQLCMLTELQKVYGWELFTRFFSGLPTDWTGVLPSPASPTESWQWVYKELSAAAGADLSATFSRYHVPLP